MSKPLIIELLVDEEEGTGVDIISFVEYPAIERDFMYFNKAKDFKFKETDTEKRLVSGPAMIPDEKIIRLDMNDEPYFVYFSEETIRKSSELYFKQSNQNSANFEHEEDVSDVTVVESWIIEDPENDKSNALGFSDLPKGTWMVTYKVYSDEVWDRIKDGEVLGFSVEGLFGQKLEDFKKVNEEEVLLAEISKLLKSNMTENEMYDIIKEKMNKK
jgi:hypothetical protein